MSEALLHVWARPLSQYKVPIASNLDHTWITTFPVEVNPTSQDEDKKYDPPAHYWYCWGSPHYIASHRVSSISANLSVAELISPSNKKPLAVDEKRYGPSSTSAAIIYYALDGLCHQTANQILASTGSSQKLSSTVLGANGYPLSTFFYGNYGLNDKGWQSILEKIGKGIKLPDDECLLRLKSLGLTDKQLRRVLTIREKAQEKIRVLRSKVDKKSFNYYPALVFIVRCALFRVLFAVGRERYRAIFPSMTIRQTLGSALTFGLGERSGVSILSHDWLKPDY